jgi:hypothetical protein
LLATLGVVFAALLCALACAPLAAANTAITSNITANTTWTASGSPYDIDTADLRVTEGVTLTIEPGVTVDFNHEANGAIAVYTASLSGWNSGCGLTLVGGGGFGLGTPGGEGGLSETETFPSYF